MRAAVEAYLAAFDHQSALRTLSHGVRTHSLRDALRSNRAASSILRGFFLFRTRP